MQIVDDHLALFALKDWRMDDWGEEVPLVPWMHHLRLLRALMDTTAFGSLSSQAHEAAAQAAISPPPDQLKVIDPRSHTTRAAQLIVEHHISALAAGMLAVAIQNGATLHVHRKNYGRKWGSILKGTGVTTRLYEDAELITAP